MNARLVPLALALRLAAAACGSPGGSTGSAPDAPVSSTPDEPVSNTPGDAPPVDGDPQRVEPRAGLGEVRAIGWDRHKVVDEGNAVDVFFWHGIEECYGIDHVDVDYGEKELTITLYEGRNPDAETCIELAVRKVVGVELEEPLGDRNVIDGAP